MSQTAPTKIGFLGSSAPSSPHHGSFKKFIPADIDFTFLQSPAPTRLSMTPKAKSTR